MRDHEREELAELLELANDEPDVAYSRAELVAETSRSEGNWCRLAGALRAQGLALANQKRLVEAIAVLDSGLEAADLCVDPAMLFEVEMTRGAVLGWMGESDEAVAALSRAVDGLRGTARARAQAQRGAMLARMGRFERGVDDLDEALPLLEAAGDAMWAAHVRSNRGIAYGYLGRLDDADRDLMAAREAYAKLDHHISLGSAAQNLGWVASLRGDVPGALHHFETATAAFERAGASVAGVLLDRCDALLAVHLASDAVALATRAAQLFDRAGEAASRAEALVTLAEAALLNGERQRSADAAERAAEMLSTQGRDGWAAHAALVHIKAAVDVSHARPRDLQTIRRLAGELADVGLATTSADAHLLLGEVSLGLGRLRDAERALQIAAEARHAASIRARVLGWRAQAELQLAMGSAPAAARSAARGLAMLRAYQAVLGSSEARANVAAHGLELADIGMRLAIESRRPRRILAWMERTRAHALAFPPASPPDDVPLVRDLAAFRDVSARLRSAQLEGRPAHGLLRERARLQDAIRRHAMQARGGSDDRPRSDGDVGAVVDAVGQGTLVEFEVVSGALVAVVVHRGRVRFRELGDLVDVRDQLDSLRAGLERLNRPDITVASRDGATSSVVAAAAALDRLLLPTLSEGPVVIVPNGPLHVVPWAMLPSLQTRPVTVAPSAAVWLGCNAGSRLDRSDVVIVNGPNLPAASREARGVAEVYEHAVRLDARSSRVDAVLRALDGAAVAHIVAHGTFRSDNPLFSSLEVADGGLTVYDLERIGRLPSVVVLSSCNAGLQAIRPGNETMGMVAGLLGAGCRTVVASTGLVPDTAGTARTMIGLHERLRDGVPVATALADVQAAAMGGGDVAAASFVCFGSG